MPIPKPTASETQSDYMGRCMHFLAHEPGSDRPQEQMVAICMNMWRDRGKKEADLEALERKVTRLAVPFEIKTLAVPEFEGYGSVFGNEDLGGDVVVPGAFSKSLKKYKDDAAMPQMFWMHDPSRVPGKWLEMYEDSHGLYVKGQLAPTPLGEEMHALMKMDAVRGLSIGYLVKNDAYDKSGRRLLKEIDLWETSLVSMAMNPLANVTHVKSRLSAAGEYVPTPREWESFFREKGCSRNVSRQMVAKLYTNPTSATLAAVEYNIFGKDSASGTPVEPRWDAADAELGRALDALRDLAIAESLPSFR